MHDLYNLAPLLLILATILIGIVFNQQGLNRLSDKIDRVHSELNAKIERVQTELTVRIDRMQADMVEFYKIQAAQGTKVDTLWDDRRKSRLQLLSSSHSQSA